MEERDIRFPKKGDYILLSELGCEQVGLPKQRMGQYVTGFTKRNGMTYIDLMDIAHWLRHPEIVDLSKMSVPERPAFDLMAMQRYVAWVQAAGSWRTEVPVLQFSEHPLSDLFEYLESEKVEAYRKLRV